MSILTKTSPKSEIIVTEPLPLDQNPAAVYLAGLGGDKARRVQKQALSVIAAILTGNPDIFNLAWAALRFQHTAAIRAKLVERYKPATANRMLSALRGTLKAAFLLGQMEAEDYQRAIMVEAVNGETLPAGRELSNGEIAALMTSCESDPTPAGARDAAIIALLYSCGLRREEAIRLDLDDYDHDKRALVVNGKRNKERTAYLVNGAARAMADWVEIRGNDPGSLFFPINKGGTILHRRMTTQAVYNLLIKRGEIANVNNFSPHDFRRTFVSDLLEAGADIATVAKMAGHASVTTTARYDRRPEEAKRKVAGLLHVPYRGRHGIEKRS